MKFEELIPNTDISGQNKNDNTLKNYYNINHFENMFVFKDVLCPHLK